MIRGSFRGWLLFPMALAVAYGCGGRARTDGDLPVLEGAGTAGSFAVQVADAGPSVTAAGGTSGAAPDDGAGEPDAGAGPNPGPAGTIVRGPAGSHVGCPELPPREFDSCTLPGDWLCKYRYSATCGGLTIARCVSDHTWRVTPPAVCGGPPGPACPEWPPPDGTPCERPADSANHDCYYPLRCEVISTCYGHWQSTNIVDCAGAGG